RARPPFPWKVRLGVPLLTAVGALVVLAPWLYAVSCFRADMPISSSGLGAFFQTFPDSVDWGVSRLFPLPLDLRRLREAPRRVSTPFLDAQGNVPLLLLAGALVWRQLRPLSSPRRLRAAVWLSAPAAYFGACLALSLAPGLYDHLPLARQVQFPYRLV